MLAGEQPRVDLSVHDGHPNPAVVAYSFRGTVEGNESPPGQYLWVAYSVHKEDIWIGRHRLLVSAFGCGYRQITNGTAGRNQRPDATIG